MEFNGVAGGVFDVTWLRERYHQWKGVYSVETLCQIFWFSSSSIFYVFLSRLFGVILRYTQYTTGGLLCQASNA